jgi:putative transposase
VSVKTLFIEPGSPWENGYVESFNGNLRDELLSRETFDTLLEAKVLIEGWRQHYNTVRPHSALEYRPPAPEARQTCAVASATSQGWSVGRQKTNLDSGVIHGGRSRPPVMPS